MIVQLKIDQIPRSLNELDYSVAAAVVVAANWLNLKPAGKFPLLLIQVDSKRKMKRFIGNKTLCQHCYA